MKELFCCWGSIQTVKFKTFGKPANYPTKLDAMSRRKHSVGRSDRLRRLDFRWRAVITTNMSSMNQSPPPAPSERIAKQTFFLKMLETIVFLGNVCGTGPFALPVVGFIAFAISYLSRIFSPASPPLFISGLFLTVIYYIFVGLFRLLVYNRHLDPLLAVPGPKVLSGGSVALTSGPLDQRSPSNHS